eukprot:m.27345 g.27345  ORF g.27345 m.27345 type:complete len:69 (+) comp29933_c0_seq1:40-246(+)
MTGEQMNVKETVQTRVRLESIRKLCKAAIEVHPQKDKELTVPPGPAILQRRLASDRSHFPSNPYRNRT